ncbi:MAG: tetratricopeptide repeat protein [Massilia sp.]
MRSNTALAAALLMLASAGLHAENFCGNITNPFGPYDYRKAKTEYSHELYLVESTHFTSEIENGIKGRSGSLANEIDYTLRAFPNHIRALASLDRLAFKEKETNMLNGSRWPVECYFERAVRFAPDDGAARSAYATYLFRRGQLDKALTMFREAARITPDDATVNYNLGLAYFNAKNYSEANVYAQKAYKLGFPLPALKNKLVGVGKWQELPDAPAPAPAPQAALPEAAKPAGQ